MTFQLNATLARSEDPVQSHKSRLHRRWGASVACKELDNMLPESQICQQFMKEFQQYARLSLKAACSSQLPTELPSTTNEHNGLQNINTLQR